MKTSIINQIDLFYNIVKQKSTYNTLFGKLLPKKDRLLRLVLITSFSVLFISFLILIVPEFGTLQSMIATLFFILISIPILYLFHKATMLANIFNKKSYINFNERVKAEVLQAIDENELDIHEVKDLKETFYRLHVKNKTNYFSWELFIPVLTLLASSCIAIWLKTENSEFMKLSLLGLYILFAFWYVFRLSSAAILNRKSERFFELYLIFSNIRNRNLNSKEH